MWQISIRLIRKQLSFDIVGKEILYTRTEFQMSLVRKKRYDMLGIRFRKYFVYLELKEQMKKQWNNFTLKNI